MSTESVATLPSSSIVPSANVEPGKKTPLPSEPWYTGYRITGAIIALANRFSG